MMMEMAARIGRRKFNLPDNWAVVKFQATDYDTVYWMAERATYDLDGETKTVWGKTRHKFSVSPAEEAEEWARYEAETGLCSRCLGKGEVFKSWNHITGTKYVTCKRCAGMGKAGSEKP